MWIKRNNLKSVKDIVLKNTGLTEEELFEDTEYPIPNLDKAAEFILAHIENRSKIIVVNDYDVDGACSGAILDLLLNHFGADFKVRPPKRFSEGYGLSPKIIEDIGMCDLIITVDNGIVAFDAISLAKDKGIDVVVIDHHIPSSDGNLPDADIIVDPHYLGNDKFNDYCGAGLAYRLLKHMVNDEILVKKAISLAALATVSDVMPLIHENRTIVKMGLKIMNEKKHITAGLRALINVSGVEDITSTDIGFKLGPMLNAPGRLIDDGSYLSYQLLASEKNSAMAGTLASKSAYLNKIRQGLVKKNMCIVESEIQNKQLNKNSCIVLYLKGINEGIIGILAGKVSEKYKCPSLVLTNKDDKILKGSGRSYGDISLIELLHANKDLFIRYGGHKGAAGFSINHENLNTLCDRISNYLPKQKYSDDLYYDLEIKAFEIPGYVEELKKYEPFGQGNPKPVFKITDFINTPSTSGFERFMGDLGQHVKIFGKYACATAFDMSNKYKDIPEGKIYEFLGTLSANTFNGYVENSIEVNDFERKDFTNTKTSFAMKLAKQAKNRY